MALAEQDKISPAVVLMPTNLPKSKEEEEEEEEEEENEEQKGRRKENQPDA
jgi:hypothetical protein